ncbi:hypothetical protein Tco_0790581 [Tanacetum coccineum]
MRCVYEDYEALEKSSKLVMKNPPEEGPYIMPSHRIEKVFDRQVSFWPTIYHRCLPYSNDQILVIRAHDKQNLPQRDEILKTTNLQFGNLCSIAREGIAILMGPIVFSISKRNKFAKVYKAFSSEVHAFRLVFSGWGVKSLSTYPMTVGLLEKKVIHGTSEPTMYGYTKNHKKTVKNGQARARESEEYKAEAKESKPKPGKVKPSVKVVKTWSTKVNKTP